MIFDHQKWMAIAVAGCLLVPTVAAAQQGADEGFDEPADEQALAESDDRPWSVSGSASLYAYQGLFVSVANDTEFAGQVDDGSGAFSMAVLASSVSPSYQWEDFTFSGQLGYTQFLTAAGGINEPYEGRFQDVGLAATHAGYTHEGSGISITPTLGVGLPTSTRSRRMTMIASTSLGARFSRMFFDRLHVAYGITGSRTFHRYTSPVVNISEIGEENALYRTDGAEAVEPGRLAVAGINTPWGLVHSLAANMSFTDRLSASISYGLSTGWSYNVAQDDEFASEYQCSGRCAGRSANGRGVQVASSSIIVDWVVNENLGVSGGIGTVQPPKSADNQRYNFPFWNFSRPAANYSSFTVGVTGRY